jgi:hypothetical protein
MGEKKEMHIGIIVGKSEGRRPAGRPKCRWEIILKWSLET